MVQLVKNDADILKCFPVMSQLRPHLIQSEFQARIKTQISNGYLMAMLDQQGIVVAAAGFRLGECLAWGRYLYIEDLVTDEKARSKGYGHTILAWLTVFAKENQCEQIHLDSGVQRFDAHQFYFQEGMKIVSHHFSMNTLQSSD